VLRFITASVAKAVLTLWAASFSIFLVARMSGNPADSMLPDDATRAARTALIERLGLDQPIYVQYGIYIQDIIKGDFGTSIRVGRPALELVAESLPNSLILATAGVLFAILISVPLGVQGAVHRGESWDRVATTVGVLGQSIPSFLSGIVAILLFAVTLGWLPTSGTRGWQYYILPAVTLGWFVSAGIVRLVRSGMLEVLDSEYVKLARSKGLREETVVWKHALRNALIPVVTFTGLMYGALLGASVATEVVFNIPGVGRLAYQAAQSRDFPVLQLTVLTWTLIIVLINLGVDLLYAALDPRVRVHG
jgi:ABC-type dipeptide/oligopeptide/nickel transport system permease component